MIISKLKRLNWAAMSVALLGCIMSLAVYYDNNELGTPLVRQLLTYVCLLLVLFIFIKKNTISLDSKNLYITGAFLVYAFFRYVFGNSRYVSFEPFYFAILLTYCFVNKDIKYKSYSYFRFLLIVMCMCSIVVLPCYLLNLLPFSVVPYYSNVSGHYYLDFGLTYIYATEASFRLCGLFNEPGLFGTIIALLLIADEYNLKKIGNIILFTCGIFTFSMAFASLSLLYCCFKYSKRIPYLVIILALTYIILSSIADDNERVQAFLDRFVIGSDGKFEGDTRTNESFEKIYTSFLHSGDCFFGRGTGYANNFALGVSSYKTYILDYGIIGAPIIWLFLLLSSIKLTKLSNRKYIYIFLFFLSIYQRPNVYAVSYFILLFGGLLYIDRVTQLKNLDTSQSDRLN